jgi:hypothetical protein
MEIAIKDIESHIETLKQR